MASLALHQHGKSRVRVARVWRQGPVHYFVELSVHTVLESDMAHAFLTPSNEGMTATDTQKNTVYYIAKQFKSPCTPEAFGIALAKHFVATYPKVSKAKITVEMAPWKRISLEGQAHEHGFVREGTEVRTAYVTHNKQGATEVTAGLKDLQVLKTTQSGYEGFLHDEFTSLPDVKDRIVATAVSAKWRYTKAPECWDSAYQGVKAALLEAFYGPPKGGVFSPSVQFTLYQMAKLAILRVPEVGSVFLNMPNLHFLPCNPPKSSGFENDVYVATSEPHGTIEAVVTRQEVAPHCRL